MDSLELLGKYTGVLPKLTWLLVGDLTANGNDVPLINILGTKIFFFFNLRGCDLSVAVIVFYFLKLLLGYFIFKKY